MTAIDSVEARKDLADFQKHTDKLLEVLHETSAKASIYECRHRLTDDPVDEQLAMVYDGFCRAVKEVEATYGNRGSWLKDRLERRVEEIPGFWARLFKRKPKKQKVLRQEPTEMAA